MSDALPLPARPNLDQYKKLARDLQHACKSGEPGAIRAWATRWLETLARLKDMEHKLARADARTRPLTEVRHAIEREAGRIDRRWRELKISDDRKAECRLADAQFFLAREHGFASWPKFAAHVESLTQSNSPVSAFESAVDAIVSGDMERLATLLRQHPHLIRARSTREHRSTLLHYISANGVEDFRQKTPKNIVPITKLLLKAGADVDAESEAYGGGSTTLGLTATSIHPEQAGVQIELLETLLAHGAHIEKPGLTGNQSSAVKGCLANGQGRAAQFFAERGARMDLEEAAGVGRLDVVNSFFDEHGALTSSATQEQLESGFMYAAGYGHIDTVRLLLEKGVDPGVHNEHGQTALHWTTYGPHVEVAKLLLAQRTSLVHERETAFDGTPLDWALYAWANLTAEEDRERTYEIVALMVQAGAKLDARWLERHAADKLNADQRMRKILGLPREPEGP
jgi:ankyrin repeat protein